MTHKFPEHYCSVSDRLSNILDNVGYSREDRDRKVTVATNYEVISNIVTALMGKMILYIFGSRGEGSTGPGLQSDIDVLHQINAAQVVTEIVQCQAEMTPLLMVNDNHTHPGYVKLQCILSPGYATLLAYLKGYNINPTIIDSLKRTILLNTIHHRFGTVSGPAFQERHDLKELSADKVVAFRCSEWPQVGFEWFQRRRLSGWPTPIQIENAREYGCFVTPVGHPHSPECHLEWRLSFSIAERDIARSFEDTTMKVYMLLKMVKKTYIEPVVGDAFSSYHCKVCMFWMRERTPNELWRNENLLQCLVLCIRQLYEWATTGFCPDYFIVINNIYDRKIIGAVRNNLLQILRNLLSSNCTFLLGIQCCNLGQHIADKISRFDYCIIPIATEERVNHMLTLSAASRCRYYILYFIPQHHSTLVDYLDRIVYTAKYLPCNLQYPLKYVMMIMWSQLGFHIATICKENAYLLSREQVDYLVALASGCLSLGINIDATSVRIKLCGLGMELGNHNSIETSLQHISDYCLRYIYSTTIGHINFPLSSTESLFRNRYNTEELLQNQISYSVVYLPSEMSITPKTLRMEMFRSIGAPSDLRKEFIDFWFDWGVIDSVVCLYFFQYLNFSRQGNERHKEVAMYNMIHVISTMPDIFHKDTALNLLGYSFMHENQLTNAYRCFNQSLKIRPYHNAAKFYLGLLFNRIHATDRGHTQYRKGRIDIFS
ncbi:hypothetical protein CHS0354_009158 [Potamilus streckersoni]|uniref:Mab-21-like HhH/H2TH-like domain-containing protein n=1 Tax=Potamilus streckersoni TaxID=2493646 RepID=A0AAE0RYT6_9BIVA|nr:hypothetical protein CHS0354_009158 [Potamilus streckersoni]